MGFGLGLTLVKQLTEGMCGTISVSSELGIGTEFLVSLPVNNDCMSDDISSVPSAINLLNKEITNKTIENRIQFNVNLEMAGVV